jgi:hypothetical protein
MAPHFEHLRALHGVILIMNINISSTVDVIGREKTLPGSGAKHHGRVEK